MIVIGLTGPSGSGKTLLCQAASKLGCETINADEVYHSLLIPPSDCLDEIVLNFGDVLAADGTLDRKKLGGIVFSDKDKLSLLNSVTHKYVKQKFREIITKMNSLGVDAVIVDAPTLFESGFDKECDTTVCLLASQAIRRGRIISRDSLDEDGAEARLAAQKSDDFFIERAEHVIYNNGSKCELELKITELLNEIKKECQDK